MARIDQYPECTTPVDNDLLLIETEEGTKKVKKSTLLKAVVDLLGDDDISEIGDGTVTGAITDIKDTVTNLNNDLNKMVELFPYSYNRILYVGAVINLSDSFLNYKYITIVYGSPNNCITIDTPSIIFKKICDSQPEKFILWEWNNIWFRIEYLTQTTLKYRGASSASAGLCLPAIYGHN